MPTVKGLALGLVLWGVLTPPVLAAPLRRGWLRWSLALPGTESTLSQWSSPLVEPQGLDLTPLSEPTTFTAAGSGLFRWSPFWDVPSPVATATAPTTPAPSSALGRSLYVAPTSPNYLADAFVNLGNGPYARQGQLTSGEPGPWYDSPVAARVYGGTPTEEQREAFSEAVVARVEQIYEQSGVPVDLTDDPNVSAAHELSVVSNAEYPGNPLAVGITDVGRDGFSFVDKLPYADTPDELAGAVAGNVAHELMHAFGAEHHDTTGAYLDSAVTPWEVLVAPTTVFSPAAASDLLAQDFRARAFVSTGFGAELLDVHTLTDPLAVAVPEPTTWASWTVVGLAAVAARRGRARRWAGASGTA